MGSLKGSKKFWGVTAIGSKAVLAPCDADVIGVLDVVTNKFETVPMGSLKGSDKFRGVTAIGSKAVFAPSCADVIGVLDVVTNKFETVPMGSLTGNGKIAGATAFTFRGHVLQVGMPFFGAREATQNSSGLRPEPRFFFLPPS